MFYVVDGSTGVFGNVFDRGKKKSVPKEILVVICTSQSVSDTDQEIEKLLRDAKL